MPRKKKPNTAGVAKTHSGQKSVVILTEQNGGIGVPIEGFGPTEEEARLNGHQKLITEITKQISAERQSQKESEGWWNQRVYLLAGARSFVDAYNASRQTEQQSLFWWPRDRSIQLADCSLGQKFIGAGYGRNHPEAEFFAYDGIAKQIALRIRKSTNPKDVAMYQELSREVEAEINQRKDILTRQNEAERQRKIEQAHMVDSFTELADSILDYDKAWRETPQPAKQPEPPLKTAAEVAVQKSS